jgi:hypothetical protein
MLRKADEFLDVSDLRRHSHPLPRGFKLALSPLI